MAPSCRHTGQLLPPSLKASISLTNPENDLRRAVVSCADDRAVVLIIERRASKVDKVNLRAEQDATEFGRPGRQCARGRNVAVVSEGLVSMAQEQDILGLEVGVNEVEVVEESNGPEQLSGESLNVRAGEGHEGAAFEEVKDREPEKRGDDANV